MKNFFTGNKIKIFLHVLAWAILLGLPLYFVQRFDVGNDFIWLYYISNVVSGIIFYLNYLVLVPRFFFNKKKLRYYLTVLGMLVFFFFASNGLNELVFKYVPGQAKSVIAGSQQNEMRKPGPPAPDKFLGRPPFRQMHLFNYVFTSMFLVFFSVGLRVLERHSDIEKWQKELEKEKLNSELAFLKNQISPHFFFNTLNNIYSLISINQDDSQKAVLKLSKLMRYLLYESEQGNTKLSNEIEFMNNYIDLMKLRMSEKINLSISFPEGYEDKSIPPLLFIPFIENAFKHGISYREKSFIDISMTTNHDSISFRCINSITKSREDSESGHSGIGLENVSKRLNLLFPGSHDLKINKSDAEFEILLQIKIA
ncbi:MAG: histidine kinase [Bacteroidales bacterium]|nr:histidine kinase [Bacteroidales bacterium]